MTAKLETDVNAILTKLTQPPFFSWWCSLGAAVRGQFRDRLAKLLRDNDASHTEQLEAELARLRSPAVPARIDASPARRAGELIFTLIERADPDPEVTCIICGRDGCELETRMTQTPPLLPSGSTAWGGVHRRCVPETKAPVPADVAGLVNAVVNPVDQCPGCHHLYDTPDERDQTTDRWAWRRCPTADCRYYKAAVVYPSDWEDTAKRALESLAAENARLARELAMQTEALGGYRELCARHEAEIARFKAAVPADVAKTGDDLRDIARLMNDKAYFTGSAQRLRDAADKLEAQARELAEAEAKVAELEKKLSIANSDNRTDLYE